jgi:hypothetical protein
MPTIVFPEPSSQAEGNTHTEEDCKKWFVLGHIYATASQNRAPLDLEAYEGSVDNAYETLVKRIGGGVRLSPDDQSILVYVLAQMSSPFSTNYGLGIKSVCSLN